MWAGDDGTIFNWGLEFNSGLLAPNDNQFTPYYGFGSDSTYWEGPFITSFDNGLDSICILPETTGNFEFTATVINDFGCTSDTVINLTIFDRHEIFAGDDFNYCSQPILEAHFTNNCNDDGGLYNYCYSNNEDTLITYCPNELDFVTVMNIEFLDGVMENFFDNITIFDGVYDGIDTSIPVIASISQELNQNPIFEATNTTGCLTLQITSDGSVSCESGNYEPIEYFVSCESYLDYIYTWSPSESFSDPNISNPTLIQSSLNNEYFVEAYPSGFSSCASQDTIIISPSIDFSIDVSTPNCIDSLGYLNVEIDSTTSTTNWEVILMENLDTISSIITDGGIEELANLPPGSYQVIVNNDGCSISNLYDFQEVTYPSLQNLLDTVLCSEEPFEINFWVSNNLAELIQFEWNDALGSDPNLFLAPTESSTYIINLTNELFCTSSDSVNIYINPNPQISISENVTLCEGESIALTASGGETYNWNDQGTEPTLEVTPTETTTFEVTATNAFDCSATDEVTVFVNPLPTAEITADQITLTAVEAESYQWYLNGNIIDGATSQTYTALQNGTYSVEVTNEFDCTSLSNEIIISVVSINELSNSNIQLFPNPMQESSMLYFGESGVNYQVKLFDTEGRLIQDYGMVTTGQLEIQRKGLSNGNYLVEVVSIEKGEKFGLQLIVE